MKNKSALATVAFWFLAAQSCAVAASSVNPNVPAANAPLASAPVRGNFAAAYNDISNLQDRSAGSTQPAGLSTFQDWANTSGCPTACLITIFDGNVPVTMGTLNETTDVFTPYMGAGAIVGAAPITATISGGIAHLGIVNGVSVLNPGTGTLEALLPIQTVTGASKSFLAADLYMETRRSNAGNAMADTFPPASTTGLVNGTKIIVTNVDATANDTITGGTGTTISGSGIVGPGRAVQYVYDLASTTWRPSLNTASALLAANNLSEITNAATARGNLGLTSLYATAAVSHEWINSTVAGVPQLLQPGFSDLSGSLAPSQCPAGTASALGCLEGDGATLSIASGIIGLNLNHANTFTATQTFPNNSLTLAEFPTIGANTTLGSIAGGTPIALSQAQITTLINTFSGSLSGAVCAPGTPSGKFLRDDCTWQPETGTGTVTEQKNTFGYGLSASGNCDNTTTNASSPCNAAVGLSLLTNTLGSNVSMTSTSSYFDGPSIAQGSTGTWWVSGNATVTDSGLTGGSCKLWDGTTVVASSKGQVPGASGGVNIHLSGYLAAPAGNLRISCEWSSTTAAIAANLSGAGKDSTISAVRVQ